MGAMGADHGPPQLSTVASVPELGAEVMPPLWQYFARVAEKADERIFAPRGMRPCTLSKISGRFAGIYCFREGHGNGAKGGDRRPPISTLSAKGMPPLCQYFSRLSQTLRQGRSSSSPTSGHTTDLGSFALARSWR